MIKQIVQKSGQINKLLNNICCKLNITFNVDYRTLFFMMSGGNVVCHFNLIRLQAKD